MELRQLHYFRVIAEEEHFGRASARLRIVQPALSRQIKLLEAELDVALFERLPRGVRLTAAGHVLLDHCRLVAAQLDRAVTETRAAATGATGVLRLGFIEVAAWDGIVPQTIRRFRDAFPDVQLALSAMASPEQIDAIRDRRIDAGILYNPPGDADLLVRPLIRHAVMLAVASGTPLGQRKTVALADLHDQAFIGFRRAASPRYHDTLFSAMRAAGFEPKMAAEMASEADMLALVNTGAGVAFVNGCQRWRPPHGVTFLTVCDLEVDLELALVCRRDNGAAVLARFVAMIAPPLAPV
ncbi:MAG: LysR family transcriptional regulator [Allorhizobium sp.]